MITIAVDLKGQWIELGGPYSLKEYNWAPSLISDASGNIYAAGSFKDSLGSCGNPKWNGTVWTKLEGLFCNGLTYSQLIAPIYSSAGNLFVSGSFSGLPLGHLLKWVGSSWFDVGRPSINLNSGVGPISSDQAGNIYVRTVDSLGQSSISKLTGNIWVNLPLIDANKPVKHISSMCCDKSGNLYAAGHFTNSSGSYYVAKWDGTIWT